MRRLRMLAAAVPLAIIGASLGTASSPVAAGTEPDAAEAVLAVEPVLSSEYEVGDHLAVRITVTAEQLVDGHVEVRTGSDGLTVRQDVQVAGGSTEELLATVPTSEFGGAQVVVELYDGSRSIDRDDVRFTHDAGTDVAGVLPVLLARTGAPPDRVSLPANLRRVDLVALPVDLLSVGAAAISQLDTIAATTDDLAALDPAALAALLAWIDAGGHLVLDDRDDLGALPARWSPGPDGYALAGRGEIRVEDGLLSAGEWADVLEPAPLGATDSPTGFVGVDMVIDPRVTLAERAGVRLPDLTTIIVVLGAYVVLIGPVLYLVLRRARRLTAAWLVIPVVALVLAGAVVLTGAGWRSSGRSTSSTVVEVHPGGGYAYVDALMFRRSGGTSALDLPDGWSASGPTAFAWFGSEGESSARTVVLGDDGGRIETRLEPGQVAVLAAEGPAAAELLELDAQIGAAHTITGTVTNTSSVMLRAVAVFGAGRATLVGDIGPGEARDYTILDIVDEPDPYSSALASVWADPRFGFGFEESEAGVDLGIWTSFAARSSAGLYPLGQVRAAGWTDELASAAGDDRSSNTTLVTVLSPIDSTGSSLAPATVRWSWVQAPFDPQTGAQRAPVVRYVVPPGTDIDSLEMRLPAGIESVEVLGADGKWAELDADDADDAVVPVPADVVIHGSLIVRGTLDMTVPVDFSRAVPLLRGAS